MRSFWNIWIVLGVLFFPSLLLGQCPDPELYDLTLANTSDSPIWVNCIDNPSLPDDFTLNVVSPNDIGSYEIDFGDGSPIVTGAGLTANTALTHTYTDLGEFTFKLYETQNGCTDSVIGTVINDRKPGASALPPTLGSSGCVPHQLTFTNQTSNVSRFTTFIWEWGDQEVDTLPYTTAGQPISHTYLRGRAGCDMSVRITAQSLCNASFSVYGPYDFWDVDTAVVNASSTALCNGDTVEFTDVSLYNCNITQPRMIQWDFTDVGGATTPWLPAVGNNRSQKFFINGNPGDVFTVELADSNFCGIDRHAVEVRIIAPPQAAIDPSPTICEGEVAQFGNGSTGDATIYYWDFGDGSPLQSTTGPVTVNHEYENSGTYTVQLVASIQDALLCSDTATYELTVLPASTSNFTMTNNAGCGEVVTNFTDNSIDAISWEWDFGIFGTFTGQNPPERIFTGAGTYPVSLTTRNTIGCGNTNTKTVTVYPEVFAGFTSDPVCLGDQTKFYDQSTLPSIQCSTGEIIQEVWQDIPGSNLNTLKSDPDYPDNPDNANVLTIFETPRNVDNDYGARVYGFICPPLTGNYKFWIASDDNSELWLSTDGNPDNKQLIASVTGYTGSREWNKFNSQISSNIQLVAGQRYYIEAIHKEGGGGDHLAVGWQLPSGVMERPIPGSRLSPYVPGGALESWSWDFGDGIGTSTDQSPTYLYSTPGEYKVKLTVSTGQCEGRDSVQVTVNQRANAVFELNDTAACTPFEVVMANKSENGGKYYWDYGDGAKIVEVEAPDTMRHVYVNTSSDIINYLITLVAESEDGCRDTTYQPIKVFPGPVAGFNFDPVLPQCSPSTLTFENLSIGASDYQWYIGAYDTLDNDEDYFSYEFVNQSGALRFDTIRLEVSSGEGCKGSDFKIAAIYPEPEFNIIALPDTGCQPANINFLATGSPVKYRWDFDDGGTSTVLAPTHTFKNLGNEERVYNVELAAESFFGCKDTVYKEIVVYPKPQANMVADVTSGCGPLEVLFQNNSLEGVSYIWDFGDGEVLYTDADTAVNHVFANETFSVVNYFVKLIVENEEGCADSVETKIAVFPKVEAEFSSLDTAGCPPLTIGFQNFSNGEIAYLWDFGDGAISFDENPGHSYQNNGVDDTTYLARLTVRSSFDCEASFEREYVVYPRPKADFETNVAIGCGPLDVEITNTSQAAENYYWTFGDGTSEEIAALNFEHTYTNINNNSQSFEITLTAESTKGCLDNTKSSITVYPFVNAIFQPTDTIGCSPLAVGFQNFSVGTTFYNWDFGDGGLSNQSTPIHIFENETTEDEIYSVNLVASSPFGCKDTLVKEITVHPKPEAVIAQDASIGCQPLDISFSNSSEGQTSSQWNFGNGDLSSSNDEIVPYTYSNISTQRKTFTVTLKVENDFGCSDTTYSSVTVYPYVEANFISSDTVGCSPWNVNFQNSSTGAQSYLWRFGDGEEVSQRNTSHMFTNNSLKDTVFNVSLLAISQYNCVDTIKKKVLIYPKPKADFFPFQVEGCTPFTTTLQNNSEGATAFNWIMGDGNVRTDTEDQFEHTFTNSTDKTVNYTIKQIVNNEQQCRDTTEKIVKVFPATKALFTPSITKGCTPLTVSFSNYSSNAQLSVWSFGDGSDAVASTNAVHEFVNDGLNDTVYTVKLLTSTDKNCRDTITQKITVYPRPVPEFIASPVKILPQDTVGFINNTEGEWSYTWDFGNPASGVDNISQEQNPGPHQYNVTGVYRIKLVATSNQSCSDSSVNFIQVVAIPPEPAFVGQGTGCGSLTIDFENNTFNGDVFTWDFGDGQFLNIDNKNDVRHTYYNTTNLVQRYAVTLLASNSADLSQSVTQHQDSVVVYPLPEISFKARPDTIFLPGEVFFSNYTINGKNFWWDFGDGNTSAEENPRHEYQEAGDYSVTLVVESEYGCLDTLVAPNVVIAKDGGVIIMPNAFTPISGGGRGGNMDRAGLNDVFGPGYIQGVVEYKLQIYNQWGELIFQSMDMNIGWDGYYRDEPAEEGVYVWKIQAKYADGQEKSIVGDVTLLRYD